LTNLKDSVRALPSPDRHAEESLRTKDEGQSPAGGELRLHALAFGIERIGLVSLSYPRAVAVIALLFVIAAGIGTSKLKIDDSLSQLFHSETAEFRQYEEVTRRFPSSEPPPYDLPKFLVEVIVAARELHDDAHYVALRNRLQRF
jgi:hypothetical protein